MVKDVNKDLHDQRMKRYFIDSAKELIRGEGIQAVNVRVVADKAGYSYATMYKYFKDVQSLTFACLEDFLQEILDFIEQKKAASTNHIDSILQKSIEYTNYFVQYPGIFHLIFCEKIMLRDNQKLASGKFLEFYNLLFAEEFNEMIKSGMPKDQVEIIKHLHFSVLHGSLMFYLNRKEPKEYKTFITNLKNDLNYIFHK